MRKLFVLMLAFIGTIPTVLAVTTVSAQCTDDSTGWDKEQPYRFERKKEETAEEKEYRLTRGEKIYTHILAKINAEETFKIALDSDLSSAFSKPNDYVAFSVLENVYGVGEIPARTVQEDGKRIDIKQKKRCVVIPKDTKIYGVVDFAHSRYPFNIGGKAKLFVTVKDFKLEDGTPIQIQFAEPPPQGVKGTTFKKVIEKCKHNNDRMCIVGRREKLAFPTQIIAAGTGAGLLILKDDETTNTIAGLSFIDSVSKVSGVDSLINPPNAQLKGKMIFDVKTEGVIEVWVALKKPEEPKKSDEEDKKKP